MYGLQTQLQCSQNHISGLWAHNSPVAVFIPHLYRVVKEWRFKSIDTYNPYFVVMHCGYTYAYASTSTRAVVGLELE